MRTKGTWGVPGVTGTSALDANELPLYRLMAIWEPSAVLPRTRPSAYVYIEFTYRVSRHFLCSREGRVADMNRKTAFAYGTTGVGPVDIKRRFRAERSAGHNNCHRPKKPPHTYANTLRLSLSDSLNGTSTCLFLTPAVPYVNVAAGHISYNL